MDDCGTIPDSLGIPELWLLGYSHHNHCLLCEIVLKKIMNNRNLIEADSNSKISEYLESLRLFLGLLERPRERRPQHLVQHLVRT